jgi:hypothetical protein
MAQLLKPKGIILADSHGTPYDNPEVNISRIYLIPYFVLELILSLG